MDIYMDILRQDCCRLGSVLSYFVLQAEGCCTNAQQNRNYYRNLKHYVERGNADEYIIYGSKRRNGCEICTFSGDPWRVEVVKKYLDNPKKVAFMREFNTYTGTYKGVEITVTSTGIGAPSAAIAMEEMYESGMQVAVRNGDSNVYAG